MAEKAHRVDVENRKDSPHKPGSELGVSSPDGAGIVQRVGKTQFGEQGSIKPPSFQGAPPIYGNQVLMDMEMLHVQGNELKATDLGQAHEELQSLSQSYPGLNPKAYLSSLDVHIVDASKAESGEVGGGILFVQWNSEDLANPGLSADLDALQNSDAEVHAALNPSWSGLRNIVDNGSFTSVIISGQGQSDAVTACDAAGLSDTVTAEELLSLISGSSIQNVVLSATEGSQGLAAMGAKLSEAGLRVMDFMESVGAGQATGALATLIDVANRMGQPGFSKEVFEAAASSFDASGGALVARLMEFEAGQAKLEDIRDMLDAFVPKAASTIEELGNGATLDQIADALQSSGQGQEGDEGKAIQEAEGELSEMTVSMGNADLVEDMG